MALSAGCGKFFIRVSSHKTRWCDIQNARENVLVVYDDNIQMWLVDVLIVVDVLIELTYALL